MHSQRNLARFDEAMLSPAGFTVPSVPLPIPAVPVAPDARRDARRAIVGIARGLTPEEIVLGRHVDELDAVLGDELVSAEAEAWVNLLASTLYAGQEASR